jgi:hypothetical protein
MTCGVCLESTDLDCKLGNCTHRFHFECIKRWSDVENSCPLCKSLFDKIVKDNGKIEDVEPKKKMSSQKNKGVMIRCGETTR